MLPAGSSARFAVRNFDNTHVGLLDDALNEVGRWREDARISLVPRTSWAIAQNEHEARVVDLSSGAVLGRGAPGNAPFAPFHATGDGVPELFFGRAWPRYGFQRWDGLGRVKTHERGAHAGTDASNSTFDTHAVGDLDGDGVDELAIAFGPWGRFDLRVFRPDGRGELELVAAHRLGRTGGLAIVRRAGLPKGAIDGAYAFADAASKKAAEKMEKIKLGAMTAASGYEEGGGAGGGAGVASDGVGHTSYAGGAGVGENGKIGIVRDPAALAGMQKNYNGEPIGVAADSIFLMMNRRYKVKESQESFFTHAELALQK